jgi:hypothetical protein
MPSIVVRKMRVLAIMLSGLLNSSKSAPNMGTETKLAILEKMKKSAARILLIKMIQNDSLWSLLEALSLPHTNLDILSPLKIFRPFQHQLITQLHRLLVLTRTLPL